MVGGLFYAAHILDAQKPLKPLFLSCLSWRTPNFNVGSVVSTAVARLNKPVSDTTYSKGGRPHLFMFIAALWSLSITRPHS